MSILYPFLIDSIQYLSTLNIENIPLIQVLSLTEVIKAIINVYAYRSALGEQNIKQITWLQGFLVCIIVGSAGTSTVALLRGEPISVINKNEFWILYR